MKKVSKYIIYFYQIHFYYGNLSADKGLADLIDSESQNRLYPAATVTGNL